MVIVGSFGLASNIVGLFLFHEHGHGHDHGDASSIKKSSSASSDRGSAIETPRETSPGLTRERQPQPSVGRRRTQSIPARQSTDSFIESFGHPATLRESFIIAADEMRRARSPSPPPRGHAHTFSAPAATVTGELESGRDRGSRSDQTLILGLDEPQVEMDETAPLIPHDGPSGLVDHSQGKSLSGAPVHGHGHGSMNMKAILLHVLGDALGNVGVIATGLIIWQTTWSFKYYFDPVISLVITLIIFSSAMPLVRSTSYILLQGVPSNIALGEVRKAILQVKGVLDLHELHVWQLSETKVVASVHISASRDYDFMRVAAQIQEALHHCGIHSATIQPEYLTPGATIVRKSSSTCLISCPSDQMCSAHNTCCPPLTSTA